MKKRTIALLMAVVMLIGVTVGGTLAWLVSTPEEVTNTFTVGKVVITLDEADVNPDGTYVTDVNNRTDENEYHLIPGTTYIKDPTVHVDEDSEDCWVFVKVENGIAGVEDSANTIAAQITAKGWTELAGVNNVYYKDIDMDDEAQDLVVFESFKVKTDIENDDLAAFEDKEVVITAYAIQKDNLGTAAEAWTAGGFGNL